MPINNLCCNFSFILKRRNCFFLPKSATGFYNIKVGAFPLRRKTLWERKTCLFGHCRNRYRFNPPPHSVIRALCDDERMFDTLMSINITRLAREHQETDLYIAIGVEFSPNDKN